MSAIIAILLFVVFITYGISERILVVSLHNIRVFLSRMCNAVSGLFKGKPSDTSDWDGEVLIEKKQKERYRSFKIDESAVREADQIVAIRVLKQEKSDLERLNEELHAKYDLLSAKVDSYTGTIRKIKLENDAYKQRLCGLQPVGKDAVAIPFCEEYEQILSMTDRLIARLMIEFERLSDDEKKLCYPFIVNLVCDKRDETDNSIIHWYSLLKDAALVPKELAFDLTLRDGEILKLEFLQKYAFEKYYRAHIASVVLFAENMRTSISDTEKRNIVQEAIKKLLESLQYYGIEVDYVPINTILPDSEFSRFEVEGISNDNEEGNKVLGVRKYAVNRFNVHVEPEKTILVVNF